MNVLDLFSGIGGFSLGLERAGMRTVAFCEIDPFCRRVLAKHWPNVPCYDDVRTLTADRLRADGIAADVICGGFPCQDISEAGPRIGIEGERSGLWKEYARIVGEVRPRFVIVENVADLCLRGMGTVLGDLATFGYDAEWHCIPAAAVGAEHFRDRVWIVAYPDAGGLHPVLKRRRKPRQGEVGEDAADDHGALLPRRSEASADGSPIGEISARLGFSLSPPNAFPRFDWPCAPVVGRGVHGFPDRVDRVRSLGNAVVPQIPEIIGRAIMISAQKTALR